MHSAVVSSVLRNIFSRASPIRSVINSYLSIIDLVSLSRTLSPTPGWTAEAPAPGGLPYTSDTVSVCLISFRPFAPFSPPFSLCFVFLPVFARQLSRILLEQMGEVRRIMDPHRVADLPDAPASRLQQFPCFLHPLLHQVFLECHMKCILEHSAEIHRIQINVRRHGNDGEVLFLQMLLDISHRL